jgi:uracil phosphoribosyltransferase
VELKLVEHPLISHYLSIIRNRETSPENFAKMVQVVASLLVPQVTSDLDSIEAQVETPMETTRSQILKNRVMLVPILRAGLGMVDGFRKLIPEATIAHLGLYRDEETLQPIVYYKKLPSDLSGFDLLVLDPMLATGGTAVAAVSYLKERHPESIHFVCLLAAPQGVKCLQQQHPDIPITSAALDRELNEKGFILPGLGDAGDRIFGTGF